MPHCPWCAEAQSWPHAQGASALACLQCDASVDPSWAHCIGCGAEAPLPERCIECGDPLDQAECAARCEACKHLVCGACFGTFSVSGAAGEAPEELLLCITCADELDAEAVEELAADEGSETPTDEPGDPEPADAAPAQEPGPDDGPRSEDAERPTNEVPPAPETSQPADSAWEVLGIAPGLPLAEVRRAYLRLVSQYHPDKVAQLGPKLQALALEETRRLNEAWSALRERLGDG